MGRRAIVGGYFVRYPLGGHALFMLHLLTGLERLGYDVVFAEHYGWPNSCYDPRVNAMSDDPSYGIEQLRRNLARHTSVRWCYVDAAQRFHGLSRSELGQECRDADIFLSSWHPTWLEEFADCRKKVFIDTDPGFTQFQMSPRRSPSRAGYASPWDFDFHFTYGARIGAVDCPIPTYGITWRPTRPPVVLDLVPTRSTPEAEVFTTVMTWRRAGDGIVANGVKYGMKDVEFARFIDLPRRVGPIFEIALAAPAAVRDDIAARGWRLADPLRVTETPSSYREYIASSRGEFSVAVNLNVATRSGWFSERTVNYLASGKPAIVQDTGFSEAVPGGKGLFPFQTTDDAVAAVEAIAGDYGGHCRAAREIAEQYFESDKVLSALLQECREEIPGRRHGNGA